MAAATVAPMAVPAFAAELVTTAPADREINLNVLNSRDVVRVAKVNIAEAMRRAQAEGLNPKIVFVDKVNGINEDALIAYDKSSSVETIAAEKAAAKKIEAFLEYAKDAKIPESQKERFTITEKVVEYKMDTAASSDFEKQFTKSAKIITVQDNILDTTTNKYPVHTYTFTNFDTEFEASEDVKVQTMPDIILNHTNNNTKAVQHKRLAAFEYALKRAVKNNPELIVTTIKTTTGYEVNIYKKDGVTKVGQVTVVGEKDKDFAVNHVKLENDFANHWAETSISNAMLNGWVTKSEAFRPKENITRAEFAQMIVSAFGITTNGSRKVEFSDVNAKDWYAQPIMRLATNGYVNGNPDGTFRPNDSISRQEAAKIMADIVEDGGAETFKTDTNGNKINVDVKTPFDDDNTIADWADESVLALTNKDVNSDNKTVLNETLSGKILSGDKGKNTFRGKDTISRAESVIMIERASTYERTSAPVR